MTIRAQMHRVTQCVVTIAACAFAISIYAQTRSNFQEVFVVEETNVVPTDPPDDASKLHVLYIYDPTAESLGFRSGL